MWWAAFEIVKSLISSIINSRLGQLALVALVSWFWSAHNTNEKWRAINAAEKAQIEALYKAELARQKEAVLEIENDAQKRDAQHAEVVADMKATIEEYMNKIKEQPHVVTKTRVVNDCAMDSGFTSVVRKLDSSGTRKAHTASGARKLR